MARRRSLLVVVALALVAAACGGGDDTDEAEDATTTTAAATRDTPATSAATSTSSSTSTTAQPDAVAGAVSAGDPYVALYGNGGYDVDHYDLTLDWFADDGRLDGVARIEATATQALSAFNLDLAGLQVESVAIDGEGAEYEHVGNELTITPPAPLVEGQAFEVEVAYGGVPQRADGRSLGQPAASGWHTTQDGIFVAGEPIAAASYHPANDHPSDKASFAFTITAPEGLTVAANGTLVSSETDGGRTTWIYDAPDPQATYLTTILIGDYVIVEDGTSSSGVVVRNVLDADRVDLGTEAFARQREMIDVFEELFGPYPFDVYGAALVEGGTFGSALETQTLSVFGLSIVADSARAENVVAHELAHQWFGNHVTLDRWEDIWLNEGFATYASALWFEATDPSFSWEPWIKQSGPGRGFLHMQVVQPDPELLFGFHVYQRGAMTLHALRREIGDDAFFTVLQEWSERFGGGNASTADFQSLAEEISGEDLGPLFDAWLRQPELPSSLDGVDLS